MKKFLILLIAALILFSGCLAQKTGPVKPGDKISIDYTGSLPDGKVFDTSIEKVAIQNNVFTPGREYKPLSFNVSKGYLFSWDEIPGNDSGKLIDFINQNYNIKWVKTAKIEKIDNGRTIKVSNGKNYLSLKLNDEKTEVYLQIDDGRADNFIAKMENDKPNIYGKREVIQGLDEGVVGMRVGESKNLTIPPEKGYGQINPLLIQTYPIIQVVPTNFSRVIEIPLEQFVGTFGAGHKVGDNVTIPRTNINLTVQNITKNVTLSYNLKVGDLIPSNAPWNETVVKIDAKNITVNYSVKKNDVIQFPNVPWNTTVVGVSNVNITLRHNPIPDTTMQTMFGGLIRVSFNETSIIMNQNPEFAGKTLIFNVTLKSIE